MENPELPDTKIASTDGNSVVRDLLGVVNSNSLYHISGTYTGHDVDGSPLRLSGKLLIPKNGEINTPVYTAKFSKTNGKITVGPLQPAQ